jgi:hypothetical protein
VIRPDQRDGAKAGLGRIRKRPDIAGDRRRARIGNARPCQNREVVGSSEADRRLRRLGAACGHQGDKHSQ